MTGFAFRLERVLHWRRARLELEQFALDRLGAECARWDGALAKIRQAEAEAAKSIRSADAVRGRDLEAFGRYQLSLEQERLRALKQRSECRERMEQQRIRLLQARRDLRLLERLRQDRRAEWEIEVNREFEALAAETYLAQWKRRSRG